MMDIIERLRSIEGSCGDRHVWPRNPDGEDAIAEITRLRAELATAYRIRDAAEQQAQAALIELADLREERDTLYERGQRDMRERARGWIIDRDIAGLSIHEIARSVGDFCPIVLFPPPPEATP